LGIQPDYDGLKINPCIPKKWDGFEVTRKFRGVTYLINVKNPNHVSKGIKRITVDGNLHTSDILPLFKEGTTHSIIVELG